MLVNISARNIGVPRYIKQIFIDLKGETDIDTTIVRDFHASFSTMDTSSRQKINKERFDISYTLDPMSLIFPEHFTEQKQSKH